jgi:hypothetical protein
MPNADPNQKILDLLKDPKTRLEVYRAIADAKADPNTGNRRADVKTPDGEISIQVITPLKPRSQKLGVG